MVKNASLSNICHFAECISEMTRAFSEMHLNSNAEGLNKKADEYLSSLKNEDFYVDRLCVFFTKEEQGRSDKLMNNKQIREDLAIEYIHFLSSNNYAMWTDERYDRTWIFFQNNKPDVTEWTSKIRERSAETVANIMIVAIDYLEEMIAFVRYGDDIYREDDATFSTDRTSYDYSIEELWPSIMSDWS